MIGGLSQTHLSLKLRGEEERTSGPSNLLIMGESGEQTVVSQPAFTPRGRNIFRDGMEGCGG